MEGKRTQALVLLFAVCFGEMFGSSLSAPAVPYYARQFGASNAEIGSTLLPALLAKKNPRLANVFQRLSPTYCFGLRIRCPRRC